MTTIARRTPDQIRSDIARYQDWQTVSTVKAGGSFAAWVQRQLAAAERELALCLNGGAR